MNVNFKFQSIANNGKMQDSKPRKEENSKQEPEENNMQIATPQLPQEELTKGQNLVADMNKEFLIRGSEKGHDIGKDPEIIALKREFDELRTRYRNTTDIKEKIAIVRDILKIANYLNDNLPGENFWATMVTSWGNILEDLLNG